MRQKNRFSRVEKTLSYVVFTLLLTGLISGPALVLATSGTTGVKEKFKLSHVTKQEIVRGRVTDNAGKPIAGVTVSEKGTTHSTATAANGSFSLKVSNVNATLVFSSLGFVSVEKPASEVKTVVLIPSEDTLDEVVVVGYGSQKKTNLTSAVSQVDPKVLQDRPSPTVANMLQGATPGLVVTRNSGRPGAQGLKIQVRGETSANGSVTPLYVIDGVISSEGTFTALNPNDIESISVLKDGGATAIYGAQSAGGVILVTTKKGSKGEAQISLASNTAWQIPNNLPKRLSLIDEMNYANLARKNAGMAPEYSEEDLYYAVNGPTFVLGENGLWRTYNQKGLIDQTIKKNYGLYNNNAQISGGGEKITYLVSLGNMSQQGMFKVGEDHFTRWNARANLSARVNKFLKLDLGNSIVLQNTNNPQSGGYDLDGGGSSILRQLFSSRMRFPIFNEDGTYYKSGSSSAFGYALLESGGFNRDRRNIYFNNVTATIDSLAKGLEFKLMYSREQTTNENRNFRRTVTYFSGPEASSADQLNNPNNYSIATTTTLRQNVQAIADYDFNLNNAHNFHVMGGYQFLVYDYDYLQASTKNLYVNDNPSLNFTADPLNKSHTQTAYKENMQSFFGRFNYNYKEKYLFEATVRSDESSRLSEDVRVKVFPSFSAGWNLAKEAWFEESLAVINELKIRASWGKVGSKEGGIGYYDFIAQLDRGSMLVLGGARQSYIYQDAIPAIGLSWETIETRNVGLDFALLNGKLNGSFDYYQKYNNNMLVKINLPATIGINIPYSNDGRLKTWGWELSLAYRDKISDDFNYNVGVNLADNQNTLIRYGGQGNIVNPGVNNKVEGYALNSIWAYKTNGYFQNEQELRDAPGYGRLLNREGVPGLGDVRYVDVNGDKVITPGNATLNDLGDLVYLGNTNPRYQFGITGGFNYRNFDFSFFVQGIAKRRFKPSNELIQPLLQSYYLPMNFQTDYWTPENRDAAYPRPFLQGGHNFVASDKWFLSGAYARLKNIQIGYTLTKETIKKLPFTRVRLYVSGEDLLTISGLGVYKGAIDPEMITRVGDKDVASPYPFARSFSFGLNIDF